MKKLPPILIVLAMICSLSAPVFAAECTWTGSGANNESENVNNWLSGTKSTTPVDTLVFGTGGSIANITNDKYQNAYVTFNRAADFTITATGVGVFGIGNITPGTDGMTAKNPDTTLDVSSRTYTISAPVRLWDSQTWTVSNNGVNTTTLVVSGAIGDNGSAYSLTKAGTGTLILSGTNTFTGGVTVNQGTIKVGNTDTLGTPNTSVTAVIVNSGGAIDLNGIGENYGYTIAGTGIGGTGALVNTGAAIGLAFSQTANIKLSADASIGGTGDWALLSAGWGTTTLNLNTFTLTKTGTNIFTLTNTTINAGTISIDGGTVALDATHGTVDGSAANFVLSNTAGAGLNLNSKNLTVASLRGGGTTGGNVSLGSGALTVNQPINTTYSGVISGAGGTLTKASAGTLALNGTNTYTGSTNINAGTLQVGNTQALGIGSAVTVGSNGTLSLGTTSLALGAGSSYTQNGNGSLDLTANSSSSYGNITTPGIVTTAIANTVNVSVGGYIPNGAVLSILNGGAPAAGAAPTVTSTNPYITFSDALSGNNLVLTANRTANGFQSVASNSNAANVGGVLDNITNPSADMTTLLTALGNSTPSEVATSENSMTPTVDGAVTQSSTAMLNNFINNLGSHLDNLRNTGGTTGVATGDECLNGVGVWAHGLGDYAHQDPRGSSNGYDATSWGISGGLDKTLFNDSIRLGLGSGYGQTFVRSKDFSGRTNINSIPATIYGEYQNNKLPFYIDAAFTFIYNMYTGSRQVTAGPTITRTASADYNGQQYSGYLEGGYSFFYKKLSLTPLVSFQYMHLHTGSYTETGAGALNLNVASQDYDLAQTGIGAKLAYPLDLKCGTLTPDLHFKWLYDWVGDKQATTAGFSGGGTSFATNGFNPAQSAYDFGVKLNFKTKYNVTIGLDYDFLFKADYYEHYGTVNVKYSF